MIRGFVNEDYEPVIGLVLILGSKSRDCSAVIDLFIDFVEKSVIMQEKVN